MLPALARHRRRVDVGSQLSSREEHWDQRWEGTRVGESTERIREEGMEGADGEGEGEGEREGKRVLEWKESHIFVAYVTVLQREG